MVTLDGDRRIVADGSILVEGQRISRVGKAAELRDVPADRTIDARHLLVTPGFVNGHMHISYAHAVRGIFLDDMGSPLPYVFRLQMAMTEDEEYHTTLLGLVELLKGGTVAFVDPGSTKFPDACLQAYDGRRHSRDPGGGRVGSGRAVPAPALRHRGGGPSHGGLSPEVERAARRAPPGVGDAVLAGVVQRRAPERASSARPTSSGRG